MSQFPGPVALPGPVGPLRRQQPLRPALRAAVLNEPVPDPDLEKLRALAGFLDEQARSAPAGPMTAPDLARVREAMVEQSIRPPQVSLLDQLAARGVRSVPPEVMERLLDQHFAVQAQNRVAQFANAEKAFTTLRQQDAGRQDRLLRASEGRTRAAIGGASALGTVLQEKRQAGGGGTAELKRVTQLIRQFKLTPKQLAETNPTRQAPGVAEVRALVPALLGDRPGRTAMVRRSQVGARAAAELSRAARPERSFNENLELLRIIAAFEGKSNLAARMRVSGSSEEAIGRFLNLVPDQPGPISAEPKSLISGRP